jgi:hypothetical protein
MGIPRAVYYAAIFTIGGALGVSSAHAAERFNLNCAGEFYESNGFVKTKPRPINRIFHIDLPGNRWCADDEYVADYYKCTRGLPIESVTEDTLSLRHESVKNLYGRTRHLDKVVVSRISGTYSIISNRYQSLWYENGKCAVAEFTAMPEPAF